MSRILLALLAGSYLAGVWLDGIGSSLPARLLPRTATYFLQVAALFPRAAEASIDYRAEGWVCADQQWEEFDTRPYFPIDSGNKENRFQRVMHFLRTDRTTMRALETYLIESHNSGRHDDGLPRERKIVGVRLVSLRIPLPSPGDALQHVERRPLAQYPDSERQPFYHTPKSKLTASCTLGEGGQ